MLATAVPKSFAAFEEVSWTQKRPINPAKTTVSDGLPSQLASAYGEVTGTQTLSAAAVSSRTPLFDGAADPRELFRGQIRSFLIEADDRSGVTPPSQDAINAALRFVDLLPVDSPVPHVSLADDGEVNFFWRNGGVYVDAGFFGDGQIYYYARVDDLGIDVDGAEPFTGRSLPRNLVIPITAA